MLRGRRMDSKWWTSRRNAYGDAENTSTSPDLFPPLLPSTPTSTTTTTPWTMMNTPRTDPKRTSGPALAPSTTAFMRWPCSRPRAASRSSTAPSPTPFRISVRSPHIPTTLPHRNLTTPAYEDELMRYGDAFAAFARMPIPAVPEPSPPPLYSGFQESEVCEYDTDALSWPDDDNDECLDECIEALQRMQLAGYYPDCFDAAPLNLYDADVPELTHTTTLPTYLVSDARLSLFGPFPSRRRPGPSRIPRFRLPCPRNTSPTRRKRPPDKPQHVDAPKPRRNRRQPRSRTPTRPRRDPPPHLPRSSIVDELKDAKFVVLPDEAVPPDKHPHFPCTAKVADSVAVLREPAPPDRRDGKMSLTVEQRRRNALRRMARKKPK
ncbi:hypothetical protein MKEN_00012800 [Mycena kentingensis (nom. inval.)]|nr:hypothetical protein MKEN_00012800 [Mycena kentingensis (nom. inval.)]